MLFTFPFADSSKSCSRAFFVKQAPEIQCSSHIDNCLNGGIANDKSTFSVLFFCGPILNIARRKSPGNRLLLQFVQSSIKQRWRNKCRHQLCNRKEWPFLDNVILILRSTTSDVPYSTRLMHVNQLGLTCLS